MADSLTRRGLVAAAPAAIVAATLPALAIGTHPDAALLALGEAYDRTLAGMKAVSPAHNDAEDAAIALMQTQPGRDPIEVRREARLDVAEAKWDAAVAINAGVIQQIIDTPARTIEGLIFKAKIAEAECYHEDLAVSVIDDLIAMGGLDA